MADTKYQILYRYINPITKQPVVNDMNNDYEEDFRFYTDKHQPESDPTLDDALSNIGNNVRSNMLFVYGGTKRYDPIEHETENYPYVVKDYYIRVPMSPWCEGPRYPSLKAAIEKCRILADMFSDLDCIKLIKIVPFKQKIKIK